MKKLNQEKLNKWLDEKAPLGREKLALDSGINFYSLRRIILGQRKAKIPEQMAISRATNISIEELFPDHKE